MRMLASSDVLEKVLGNVAGALFRYGPATAMVVGLVLLVVAGSGTVPGV